MKNTKLTALPSIGGNSGLPEWGMTKSRDLSVWVILRFFAKSAKSHILQNENEEIIKLTS